MGRTIPSFRIASMMEEKEWKPFRKDLDKKDRKMFDGMFSIAHISIEQNHTIIWVLLQERRVFLYH